MNKDMHNQQNDCGKSRRHSGRNCKVGTLLLSLLLLITVSIGGTLAYLVAKTDPVVNTFVPSKVETEVEENFDGKVKTDVNVKNIGDVDAYVRIKLVTYRVNNDGDRIGGTATIPSFTPGEGWVEKDGCYYYTNPVAPNQEPVANLVDSITLVEYDDADGGKQVIEVMAEGIQANPKTAVQEAWGVTVKSDGTLDLN